MDETAIRLQALNIANQRAKQGATAEEIMATADKLVAFLKAGVKVQEAK